MANDLTPWLVLLVWGVIVLGGFALWIWALVNAARNGKWVWFVLTFVFPLLCVVYLLFAYERPARV